MLNKLNNGKRSGNEIEMKRMIQSFLSVASAVIFFTGCSLEPSTDDGEKIFQDEINSIVHRDQIKLVSFKKVNGQSGQIENREGMTVHSYSLEYSAEVEAIQRCVIEIKKESFYTWGKPDRGFSFFDDFDDLQPEQIGHESWDDCAIKLNSGQRCIINGTIILEKTEKGWTYNKFKASYLQTEIN